MKNRSNVPFIVDFCTYKIVDKQVAKRTVSQEKQLVPLRQYPGLEEIADNSTAGNVILLANLQLLMNRYCVLKFLKGMEQGIRFLK
jgi:hypothetical protein